MTTAQFAPPRSVVLTLSPAVALSLLVHAGVLIALLSWVSVGDRTPSVDPAPLAVRLVGLPQPASVATPPEQVAEAREDEGAAIAIASAAPIQIAAAQPAAVPAPAPAPASAAPMAPARAVPLGSVDVRLQDHLLMTGLPNELAVRTTTEFPVEVARLVRMPSRPVVAYPPQALTAQRQGSVLAWVTVAADGNVEEVILVDGDAEFFAPVEAALSTTRFVPAIDRSGPIRFYTLLRFDFAGASPAAVAETVAGSVAAPRAAPP